MFDSDNDNDHQPEEPAKSHEFDPKAARWYKARPAHLPRPTYWPLLLALGLTFLFWGLLTTWIIGLAGLLLFGVALTGWINSLRHE